MIKRDFLSITDLSAKEIWQVLIWAKKLKIELKTKGKNKPQLIDKQMVMLFEKPSLRTKLSFDIAISQLGGHAVYFGPKEVGLGKRESIADVSKVISSMADLIVARVFSHQDLESLSQNSRVPVINALSDIEHPCQVLADLMTIWEIKRKLKSLTLTYIGDGENNVSHSLSLGCALLGINFKCAAPDGFWMNKDIVNKARQLALNSGAQILETDNPKEAVKGTDVVYTDTWLSMGDTDRNKRLKIFQPFQVNQSLMILAKKDAIFMHDLPAYRGNEVSAEVIDGPQSVVFRQAENRLHVQKALLIWIFEGLTERISNVKLGGDSISICKKE
ncbi:ornithine carbamoyltransferase [Candidatus Daviesbacteria bacterium]|nr:ornithine carbamoyltransferase [Candidatus Daviesbacteria bacterium]